MNTKVKTKMKSKTEILNLLKQYKPKAQREYGLTRLGIFGSVARDEQTGDSDVDILIQVDHSQPVGLFKLSGMHFDLQDLLGLPVDLVTDKGLMEFVY